MIQSGITLNVLINNKPIPEFRHNDKVFIEGRGGSNYELEIHNSSWQRVEVVVSVDGLSVTDGKPAGAESRGYIVSGRGTIRIPGWKLDAQNAAKFAFASKDNSYATQMSAGDSRNNGVIGLLAYSEQPVQPNYPLGGTLSREYHTSGGTISNDMHTSNIGSIIGSSMFTANSMSRSYDAPRGIAPSASASAAPVTKSVDYAAQSLGTAFGEQTGFRTQTVSFQRGPMLTMMSIYYDNLKGLRARGVPIERKPKRKSPIMPNAFPGLEGCVPPPNWNG